MALLSSHYGFAKLFSFVRDQLEDECPSYLLGCLEKIAFLVYFSKCLQDTNAFLIVKNLQYSNICNDTRPFANLATTYE